MYRGLNPASGARSLLPGGYPQRRVRGAFNPAASCADSPPRRSPAAAKSACKFGTASARCQGILRSSWGSAMPLDGSLMKDDSGPGTEHERGVRPEHRCRSSAKGSCIIRYVCRLLCLTKGLAGSSGSCTLSSTRRAISRDGRLCRQAASATAESRYRRLHYAQRCAACTPGCIAPQDP